MIKLEADRIKAVKSQSKQNVNSISDLLKKKVKMTQWKKKILNRKNGKGTVTEAKDDNEVKATKILEFIPETCKQDAKEGNTVRYQIQHPKL